jgi:peroxiredoxin Q/BCP
VSGGTTKQEEMMAIQSIDAQIGASAPDFTLPTAQGSISLEAYHGRQNVVLYFMRTFDCPVCLGHVMRLARTYEQIQAQNTVVLVLGPGDQHEAEALQRKVPFQVLADPDRAVYQAYGLGKALGIQQSGTFVIDSSGTLRYANRATVPLGAMKEPALLAAIAQANAL